MFKYGIIVEDANTGKRIEGVKVEITDFTKTFEGHSIFDSGITDKLGFVELDPEINMLVRKAREAQIKRMTKND